MNTTTSNDHETLENARDIMKNDTTDSSMDDGSQRRVINKRHGRRRRGSDPEDIFNPDANNDDIDTDGDMSSDDAAATERDLIAPREVDEEAGCGCCKKPSQDIRIQQPQDGEQAERRQRVSVRVDLVLKVHTGSMLPMTMLLEKGKIDARFVVDHGTGATAMHYAAHNGNLKFLRWLVHKFGLDQDLFNVKDKYGLNVAHYAARMGQLPCLMYAAEHMQVQLDVVDNFGSSPLDLTLHYKHLYCFIYLYFGRGQRKLNLSQLQDRAEVLCQPVPAEQEGASKQKAEDTFRLVQLLVRLDADGTYNQSLSKMFAPHLIVQALANKRLDIVREVYDNCHYLPKLAQEQRSQSPTAQNLALPEMMLRQMSEQVQVMPHLTADQKTQVNAIFEGHHWKNVKMVEEEADSYSLHVKNIMKVVLLLLLTFCLLVNVQMENTDDFFEVALTNPYAMLAGNGKPNKWHHPRIHALFFVALHMTMVGVMITQLRLACAKPLAAKVLATRFERGRGLDMLVQTMRLKDAQGRATTEQLPYLEARFDEIDFDSLMIKSPMHDFSPLLQQRVRDWHGRGTINPVLLTRENFRAYAWLQILLQCYLFLVIVMTLLYQNVHMLQNSKGGIIGSLTEIHLMSVINLCKTTEDITVGKKLSMFLVLAIAEIAYMLTAKSTVDTMFAIAHQMTLAELANPWKYAPQARLGSIFNLSKKPVKLQGGESKVSNSWRWQLEYHQYSTITGMFNIINYLVLCAELKSDQVVQSSVSNERLWQLEERLDKSGGVPRAATPAKSASINPDQGDIEMQQI